MLFSKSSFFFFRFLTGFGLFFQVSTERFVNRCRAGAFNDSAFFLKHADQPFIIGETDINRCAGDFSRHEFCKERMSGRFSCRLITPFTFISVVILSFSCFSNGYVRKVAD